MKDPKIKFKFLSLFFGVTIFISTFYFTVLYNTFNNPLFDYFYTLFALIIIPLGGISLYLGIGKNLSKNTPIDIDLM